jgi:predicted ribosomally synthesized peptide with SipW-like signal peptide
MLNKLKSRLAVISLVAIVLTLLTQGTLAYYTTIGTATNVVTSGDLELTIREMTDQGTEFPTDGVYIIPGDVVSKVVTVENTCSHPFYLRVKLVYGIDSNELPYEDCFKLDINSENWLLHDGWYYYTGILQPGEETPEVFSHVEIVGSRVDTSYIGKTLSITVKAQAVQSENNPLPVEGDFTSVSGWPAEKEG